MIAPARRLPGKLDIFVTSLCQRLPFPISSKARSHCSGRTSVHSISTPSPFGSYLMVRTAPKSEPAAIRITP